MLYIIVLVLVISQYTFGHEIILVSIDMNGNPVDGRNSRISEDARFIAFTSSSNNIVEEDSNFVNRNPLGNRNAFDVFIYDREKTDYTRVSLTHKGEQIENGDGILLSTSRNMDHILYYSTGTFQFPNDRLERGNFDADIFLYDKVNHQTLWLSVSPDGIEGEAPTLNAVLSGNGRFVMLYSLSSNFLPQLSPYNSKFQIIRVDSESNERKLVSQSIDGIKPVVSPPPSGMSINYNGRYAALISSAANLTEDGVGGIFLRDTQTKTTELISRDPNENPIEFEFLFEPDNTRYE